MREVSQLGMEVCVTLGEIGPDEARKLKEAGVTAYNHNIDTSPEFYPEDRQHPHLQRSPDNHRRGAGKRHVGLLRRDRRDGRNAPTTGCACSRS